MAVYQFHCIQNIPASLDEVWEFISSPKNLARITPDKMDFKITTDHLSEKMYPGMMITYKVKPLAGIPVNWVTEITHVKDKEYFVDEQRQGPYRIWHHEHKIREIEGGVEMEDLITYEPPFGVLGKIANGVVIHKTINGIFDYRTKALIEIFGEFKSGKK